VVGAARIGLRPLAYDPEARNSPGNLAMLAAMRRASVEGSELHFGIYGRIGRAMDAAIANYPGQRFTLRNGILVIRQYPRTQSLPAFCPLKPRSSQAGAFPSFTSVWSDDGVRHRAG
jgi:hypothetical protein